MNVAFVQLDDPTQDNDYEPQELRIVGCDKNNTVVADLFVRIKDGQLSVTSVRDLSNHAD